MLVNLITLTRLLLTRCVIARLDITQLWTSVAVVFCLLRGHPIFFITKT